MKRYKCIAFDIYDEKGVNFYGRELNNRVEAQS
jgi:hypothetical protein